MVFPTRSTLPMTLLLPLACSPHNRSQPTSPEQDPNPAVLQDPTYYADIKPILESKCVSCHQAGGIAPFALDDPTSVVRMQRAIVAATQNKSMPPWLAAEACQDYENDRSLNQAQIQTIAAWSKAGAKLGQPGDYVPLPTSASGLSRVDREIMPAEAYKPKDKANDYRCFVLDWSETSTRYITGVGVQPGHPDIVHHVIAYRAPVEKLEAVKALDEAEQGPGYTCFGGPLNGGGRLPQIAAWAPGGLGHDLPVPTGLKIEPGSKIVMQVHYNTDHSSSVPDQTKLLLKLEDTVEKEAFVLPFTNSDWVNHHTMLIPAGQSDVVHSYEAPLTNYASTVSGGQLPATSSLKVYSIGLHMHLLGQKTSLQLERKDGGQACLLDIPRWDFHWQGGYVLKDVMTVEPGDKLKLECHFNNPGTKDVNWGEGTEDEMCLGFVYVSL